MDSNQQESRKRIFSSELEEADPSEYKALETEYYHKEEYVQDAAINAKFALENKRKAKFLKEKKEYQKNLKIELQLKRTCAKFRLLNSIYQAQKKDPQRTVDGLHRIVADEEMLWMSYGKISVNKGALTPGTENETADEVSKYTM